jgi:hypothetical protein
MVDSYFFVVVGLLAGGVCLMVFSVWHFARSKAALKQGPSVATRARTLGRLFHDRINHFKGQMQTLEQHANEYSAVFTHEDWTTLKYTVHHLEQTNAQIQGLIVTKQYDGAVALLNGLYNTNDQELSEIQHGIDSFKARAEWESNLRVMLKRVVQDLESATEEITKSCDPAFSRKRRPTLVTLADVKKSLLEDAAISREL